VNATGEKEIVVFWCVERSLKIVGYDMSYERKKCFILFLYCRLFMLLNFGVINTYVGQ
jgi:hypothetical protein